MKKIRASLMLTLLLSSLGFQTTSVFASETNQETAPTDITSQKKDASQGVTDEQAKPLEEDKSSETPTNTPQETGNNSDTTQVTVEKDDTKQPSDTKKEISSTDNEKTSQSEEPKQDLESTNQVTETTSEDEKQIDQTVEATYTTSNVTQSATSVHYNANKSTQDFIKSIGESARQIGLENDLYASVMIAQSILESGSGQSDLASEPNFNLFGIKGDYQGNSVSYMTNEDDGAGHLYSIESSFRKYSNYKKSLQDYADLMAKGISGNSDFYKGVHKSVAGTYQQATQYLTGTYATDSYYQDKLNGLIETYHLTEYDKEKAVETTTNNKQQGTSFEIKNPITQQSSTFIMPLESDYVVSSPFENRDNPITGESEHHNGIDLAIAEGTPIHASNDGTVVQSGYESGAGNYVLIQHDNGLITNYYHMSQIATQTEAVVKAGDVIGYVGSTGNSTGSHLHFGLSTGLWSGYLNPADYMNF